MRDRNETTFRGVLVPIAALALLLALPAILPAQAPSQSGSLAEAAAADYRQAARYPDHSRPVEPGQGDPLVAGRTPTRHSLAGPNGALPELVVEPAEVSFVAPEPVVLYAALEGAGGSPLRGATVTGRVIAPSGAEVGEVRYHDDGVAPDERAGDGVYTARFDLPGSAPGAVPELAASFLVEVLATLPDGTSREIAAGFLYSNPWARLTGAFRDELRDGDLVILAEVEVERAGRFHLEGVVSRPNGEPIGWAQAVEVLEPGRHWMELELYGLIFRERGAAGPYRLGSVALTTTGAMPNALGPVLENAHRTRAYPLSAFTATPFGDPSRLRAAERLDGVPAQ